MKKLIASVLAVLFCMSAFAGFAAAEGSAPATGEEIAALFVQYAGEEPEAVAAIKGEASVSREDFFVLLGKVLGFEEAPKSLSMYKFTDVLDVSAEKMPMLNTVYTRAILTVEEGQAAFLPKEAITAADVETALNRAYNMKFAPAGCTLTPIEAPYLTKNFNRYGKMDPSLEMHQNIYLIKERPFNIVDNIYFVGNTWTSSYIIDTGEGLILLDNSTQDFYPLLIESIYELGFDPHDIKWIILSHAHGDHYGCINLLKHDVCPDAITYIGDVDAPSLISGMTKRQYDITKYGFGSSGYYSYNEGFIPDVYVKDYDVLEFPGGLKIEAITTPGHTDGVQSHFWTTPSGLKIGLYGGAGFSSMGTARLQKRGFNDEEVARWQAIFAESIDKVWDKEVDVTLGNHPFHNDMFEKADANFAGDGTTNAFIDPTYWHTMLQELRDSYAAFLEMTPEEVDAMYKTSYLLIFRDKSINEHEWPWVEDIKAN